MSAEIRRLHRKPTTFTNFTGNQTNELTSHTESVEPNIEDSSRGCRKRRRRRRSDSQNETSNISNSTSNIEATQLNIKDDSQDTPLMLDWLNLIFLMTLMIGVEIAMTSLTITGTS